MKKYCYYFLLSVTLAIVGCGPKTTTVTGTVTIDGEPAKDMVVVFQSTAETAIIPEPAHGITDANGRFSLAIFTARKRGALPGDYAVSISWRDPNPPKDDNLSNPSPYTVPLEAREGRLRYTVESKGSQTADFHLVNPVN